MHGSFDITHPSGSISPIRSAQVTSSSTTARLGCPSRRRRMRSRLPRPSWRRLSSLFIWPQGHSRLVAQTSECTFSAISKPILATEGLFCSSSWDLQGLHTFFAPLQTWHLQFFVQFRKRSVTFPDFFKVSLTLCFSSNLQQHCSNLSKRSRKLETFCKFNGKKVGWLVA